MEVVRAGVEAELGSTEEAGLVVGAEHGQLVAEKQLLRQLRNQQQQLKLFSDWLHVRMPC